MVVWGLWWSMDYMYVLAGQWYGGLGTGGRAVVWWQSCQGLGGQMLEVWGAEPGDWGSDAGGLRFKLSFISTTRQINTIQLIDIILCT